MISTSRFKHRSIVGSLLVIAAVAAAFGGRRLLANRARDDGLRSAYVSYEDPGTRAIEPNL